MYDVITIGAATRDVFLKSKNFEPKKDKSSPSGESLVFHLGSKNEVDEVILSTGGGATNAAVTFSRQKLKTACISRIGNDSFGDMVISDMQKEGVFCDFIQKDKKEGTAYSVIITANNGSRTVLVRRGLSGDIKHSEIHFANMNAKWLYISSLNGNFSLLSKLVGHAHKNGIKVALNPGSKELAFGLEKLKPILNKVDVFFLNEEEAADLTGISFKKEKEIFRFLDEIVDGVLVMTKGGKGVSVSDGEFIYGAGVPDSGVIERTGAGDAFNSGFVSALLSGRDISDAIQFGTANATSVIQFFSAKTGILKKGKWGKWKKVEVLKTKCNY